MIKKFIAAFGMLLTCLIANCQYNKDVIVEPILKTDTTTLGQKIIYPQFADNEVTIVKVTIQPGGSTGWHKHNIPVFAYVLEGTLTVELEGNKSMDFPQNTSFAEVLNTYHNGHNKGKENLVLIAFYMGEKGKPLSIRKE
jgi:quercetin dioxygenase-like cupin family protein